jgi:hypothetical protein
MRVQIQQAERPDDARGDRENGRALEVPVRAPARLEQRRDRGGEEPGESERREAAAPTRSRTRRRVQADGIVEEAAAQARKLRRVPRNAAVSPRTRGSAAAGGS